jgi:hypothetical protein
MKLLRVAAVAAATLGAFGCMRSEPKSDAREVGEVSRETARDAETATERAARKAGRAAHNIADETAEAARKAGREIRDAAKAAREGWSEADESENRTR